jgi:hypothetical protein
VASDSDGKVRLVIAGPRDFDPKTVDGLVNSGIAAFCAHAGICLDQIGEVVSGHCPDPKDGKGRSVDLAGERWARRNGVPVREMPADWTRGRRAGPERNKAMATYAAADGPGRGGCLLLRDSRRTDGTESMNAEARAAGLVVLNWKGPHAPRERVMAYRLAWRKGAAGAAVPPEWNETALKPDLLRAYADGSKAASDAAFAEMARLGVDAEEAQGWALRGGGA